MRNKIRGYLKSGPLDIIVIGCTHERYEQQLAQTGHNFWCLNDSVKQWNRSYGKIPENYHIINSIPIHVCPDLVMTHITYNRFNLGANYANFFSIPLIRHTHTIPESTEEANFFRASVPTIDTFISSYSMNLWNSNAESFVVNHGLDTNFWSPQECSSDGTIMSVVNFWKDRDWACGWNLYEQIKSMLPKASFKVFGDNKGLSSPAKSLEHLREELSKSRIFLNTSLHSPIPMSLLEAMACGCAVVSTDTCMIPEFVKHEENGLLGKTPEDLVNNIKRLQSDPELAKSLGENARKTIVEKYNINIFIERWNKIFNHAISINK